MAERIPTIPVRFTRPEMVALRHAADLAIDVRGEAHLDCSPLGSARGKLGPPSIALVSERDRRGAPRPAIVPLKDAAAMLAQAQRNEMTLRTAARLLSSDCVAACPHAFRERLLAQALAATGDDWALPGLRDFGDQLRQAEHDQEGGE
jgi:hypothetical protein